MCDAHAPLSEEYRATLASIIKMRWGEPRSELSSEDWVTYQQLCDRSSSASIVDSSDYYAFFTYSMFWGVVAQ